MYTHLPAYLPASIPAASCVSYARARMRVMCVMCVRARSLARVLRACTRAFPPPHALSLIRLSLSRTDEQTRKSPVPPLSPRSLPRTSYRRVVRKTRRVYRSDIRRSARCYWHDPAPITMRAGSFAAPTFPSSFFSFQTSYIFMRVLCVDPSVCPSVCTFLRSSVRPYNVR